MYSNLERYVLDRKPPIGALLNPYLSINQGLVCFPIMWEGAGTTVEDLSGNGYMGEFNNNPAWISGNNGAAIEFFGSNQYIDMGVCPEPLKMLSTDFTVIAYVNPQIAAYQVICGSDYGTADGGWSVGVATTNRMLFSNAGDADVSVDNIITLNQWQQLAWVYTVSGPSVEYFVDAISKGTDVCQAIGYTATRHFAMGVDLRDFFSNDFDGYISYIYIYNRALPASEIALLHREPFCGFRWTSIEQLAAYIEEAPPEIKALFMDLSTQLWTIKHSQGIFTKL